MTLPTALRLVDRTAEAVPLATETFGDLVELRLVLVVETPEGRRGRGLGAVLLAPDEPVAAVTARLARPLGGPVVADPAGLAAALLARWAEDADAGLARILRTLVEDAVFEATVDLAGGGAGAAAAVLRASLGPGPGDDPLPSVRPPWLWVAPDLRAEDLATGRFHRLAHDWMPRVLCWRPGGDGIEGATALATALDAVLEPYALVMEVEGDLPDRGALREFLGALAADRRLWRLHGSLRLVATSSKFSFVTGDAALPPVASPGIDPARATPALGPRLFAREGILTAARTVAAVRAASRRHGHGVPRALAPHLAVAGAALLRHLRRAWLLGFDHAPLVGGPETVTRGETPPPGPWRRRADAHGLQVRLGRVDAASLFADLRARP